MASYTRANAWNDGGTFSNQDLYWYAKGVGEMMSRGLDDQNSWWFFAAIHGEYLSESGFPGWGDLPAPPQVPTMPMPPQAVQDQFWNQCQHQSWFFPPWHRGYLVALEAQIRDAVVSVGGPSSWALPYWNYFGPGSQFELPPAFAAQTLPDGTPNPLFVAARYGPQGNGSVFVVIPPVSQACLANDLYTGSNAATPRPGFGGPKTGFWHGGGTSGNLESNPHNQVHVDIGGDAPGGQTWGLMSDPGLAALDPIFYLHHCNIDRMWAAWNANANGNPTDADWLNGPTAVGEREFVVPMPGSTPWVFTPADVASLSELDYTYDDLSVPASARPAVEILSRRLERLGVASAAGVTARGAGMDSEEETELVGAHDGAVPITSAGARVSVRLEPSVRAKVAERLATASFAAPPDRMYLQLENVRGSRDAHKLAVYVNDQVAGTVALFGLRRATLRDGHQAGQGLDFELDITDIVDRLHLDHSLDADALDVRIIPDHAVPADAQISVGRVGIYREGHR